MINKSKGTFLSSKTMTVISIVILICSCLFQQTKEVPLNNIDWDGYGYYLYLPSLFIYGDHTEYQFAQKQIEKYKLSSSDYQLIEYEDNKKHPRYNLGLALIWTPAFIVANAIASMSDTIPQNGLSSVYQIALLLTHLLFIVLGLWYLRKYLIQIFSDASVGITLILIALSTNLFYYSTSEIALTHSYLFTLLSCFLFHFYNYKKDKNNRSLWKACALFGLMALSRSSEILLIILPFFYGLNRKSLKVNIVLCTKLGVSAIAFMSPQLVFYKLTTGEWIRNGYGDRSFDFLDPHIMEGLFSYARGWIIYTPLMIFIFIGIGLLIKKERNWFAPIFLCLSANIYVLYSWDIWWYGDTFGSRPMVQHYAYLSIALAAFIEWIISIKNPSKYLVYFLLLFFGFLNLFQTWQYNQRILPLGLINKEYYWASFLKTQKDNHRKILIDVPESSLTSKTKEVILESKKTITSFGKNQKDYEEFTKLQEIPILNNKNIKQLSNSRIGIEVSISYKGDSFGEWNQPKLVTQIMRNGKSIKWTGVRIPIAMNNRNLDRISYNFICPELQIGDVIECLIWNKSADEIIVDSFKFMELE